MVRLGVKSMRHHHHHHQHQQQPTTASSKNTKKIHIYQDEEEGDNVPLRSSHEKSQSQRHSQRHHRKNGLKNGQNQRSTLGRIDSKNLQRHNLGNVNGNSNGNVNGYGNGYGKDNIGLSQRNCFTSVLKPNMSSNPNLSSTSTKSRFDGGGKGKGHIRKITDEESDTWKSSPSTSASPSPSASASTSTSTATTFRRTLTPPNHNNITMISEEYSAHIHHQRNNPKKGHANSNGNGNGNGNAKMNINTSTGTTSRRRPLLNLSNQEKSQNPKFHANASKLYSKSESESKSKSKSNTNGSATPPASASASASKTTTTTTPKSLLRKSSSNSTLGSGGGERTKNNNNNNNNQKKIQWDQSILNQTKNIDDNHKKLQQRGGSNKDPTRKGLQVAQVLPVKKRYDELLQHDILEQKQQQKQQQQQQQQQQQSQFRLGRMSSIASMSLSSIIDDTSSTSASSSASISASTSVSSSYFHSSSSNMAHSNDTTRTVDEIAECVNDVLEQTMPPGSGSDAAAADDNADDNADADDDNDDDNKSDNYYNGHRHQFHDNMNGNNTSSSSRNNNNNLKDRSDSDPRSILRNNKAEMNTSYNTTNVTAEIAECVADLNNQTMASFSTSTSTSAMPQLSKFLSPISVTRASGAGGRNINTSTMFDSSSFLLTNTTAEIEECVADVLDQTIAHKRRSSAEITSAQQAVVVAATTSSSTMGATTTRVPLPLQRSSSVYNEYNRGDREDHHDYDDQYLSFDKFKIMHSHSTIEEEEGEELEEEEEDEEKEDCESYPRLKKCPAFDISTTYGCALDRSFSCRSENKGQSDDDDDDDNNNNNRGNKKLCYQRKAQFYRDEDDTVSSSIAIQECVADVFDQSMAAERTKMNLRKMQLGVSMMSNNKDSGTMFVKQKTDGTFQHLAPPSPVRIPASSFRTRVNCASSSNQSFVPSLDGSSVSSASTFSTGTHENKDTETRQSNGQDNDDRTIHIKEQKKQIPQEYSSCNESSSSSSTSTSSSTYISCNSFEMQNMSNETPGERSPDVSANLIKIGISLLNSGQFTNAITTFREALRIRQKRFGYDHPLVAKIHNNLGVAFLRLRNYEQGLKSFQNALNSHNNALNKVIEAGENNNSDLIQKFDIEIAEMLCNVGSVCLDWLDKDPSATELSEKLELAEKAEHAFARALAIQLYYFQPNSSLIDETKKMCNEARNVHQFFQEEHMIKDRKKDESDFESAPMQVKNEQTEIPLSNDMPNDESCQTSYNDASAYPFDERTFRDMPFDERSIYMSARRKFVVAQQVESDYGDDVLEGERLFSSSRALQNRFTLSKSSNSSNNDKSHPLASDNDSNLSLFLNNGPCQMGIIDSDVKEIDSGNSPSTTQESIKSSHLLNSMVPKHAAFSPMISPLTAGNSSDHDIPFLESKSMSTPHGQELSKSKAVLSPDTQMHKFLSSFEERNNRTEPCSPNFSYADVKEISEGERQPFSFPGVDEAAFETSPSQTESPATGTTHDDGSEMEATMHHTSNHDRESSRDSQQLHRDSLSNEMESDLNRTLYGTIRKERDGSASPTKSLDSSDDGIVPVEEGRILREELPEDVLLSNPEKYMYEIHDAAAKFLKDGKLEKSLLLFEVLLSTQKSKYGELHHTIGSSLHNIGIVLLRSEKYHEALASFEKAVRVRKGSIGRDHADVAVSLVKTGITQLLLRKFDDALLTFREALSIRRHSMGHLHPSTARIYNNIGCVHVEFNEMREARRAFEAALDVQRNALCYEPDSGPLLFGTATTLCNLGYLYTYRSMNEKASMVLKEAAELQHRVIGPSHPTVLSTLDALADSYVKSGDNASAMDCYKDVINRLEMREMDGTKLSPRKQRALAIVHYKMSRVHRKQNDFDAAFRALSDSWASVNQIGAPDLLQRIKNEIEEVEAAMKNNMDWL